MVIGTQLPHGFQDLETWVERWALDGQAARYNRRRTSSMAELQGFYDALLPRMDEMIGHLNTILPSNYDEWQSRLINLALMFIETAMAVELFHEPDESTAMPGNRYDIIEGA